MTYKHIKHAVRLLLADSNKPLHIRKCATKTLTVQKEKLSQSLCLRQVDQFSDKHTKPLVLFFPWLTAPPRAVDRFCDLYHQRGWDVLTIKGSIGHFTWPPRASHVTQEIIELLTQNDAHSQRPLLVQGMSVGAYLYTVMLMDIQKDKQVFDNIAPRVRAQVFDSIVVGSLGNMSTGMAISLTANPIVQTMITSAASAYFALTKKHTVDFYEEAVKTFYENPLGGPVLYFYSHNDPMCDPKAMECLVDSMRQSGRFTVTVKSWMESPHAGHLRTHNAEYLQTLSVFLADTSLGTLKG